MTSLPLSSGLFGRSICLGLLETCPRLGRQEKPPPEGSLSWIQRLSGGCWSGEGGENALAEGREGSPDPLQGQRGGGIVKLILKYAENKHVRTSRL